MSGVVLTDEQRTALNGIVGDVRNGRKVVSMGGYAGTGKTTVINELKRELRGYHVCAFTGKAADQLRKKGLGDASTIHSAIYKPSADERGKVVFRLKDRFEINARGFIVDEASMVSKTIDADLRSFGLPVVYVGDHGQLEPVGDLDVGLMKRPDYRLETIHRNAGDIARFAEFVRMGGQSKDFLPSQEFAGAVQVYTDKPNEKHPGIVGADQVIVAFNATRVSLNAKIRAEIGKRGLIDKGERVMCLKNDRGLGLFNGMQGVVAGRPRRGVFDFDTAGRTIYDIEYDPDQFGKERFVYDPRRHRDLSPFDYAYVVTAHKSQGDEWNSVAVIEQKCSKWDHRRWAYTAASRAKASLAWFLG